MVTAKWPWDTSEFYDKPWILGPFFVDNYRRKVFFNMPLQFNPFGRSHNKGALLATAQPHSTPAEIPGICHLSELRGPLLSSYHRYSQGTLLNSELQCPRTSEPLNYPLRIFSPGMGYDFFCTLFVFSSCWWDSSFSLLYGLSTALLLVKIHVFPTGCCLLLNLSPCDNEILGKGHLWNFPHGRELPGPTAFVRRLQYGCGWNVDSVHHPTGHFDTEHT